MYCKLKKCEFGKRQIKYLGYKISDGTVSVDPAKTEAISTWPEPSCVCELQYFISLANYYNEFILSFATIAALLTDLLSIDR